MSLGTIITSSFYVQCLFWSDRNLFLRINMDIHRQRNTGIIQYHHYFWRLSLSWPLDWLRFEKGYIPLVRNVHTALISFSIYKDGGIFVQQKPTILFILVQKLFLKNAFTSFLPCFWGSSRSVWIISCIFTHGMCLCRTTCKEPDVYLTHKCSI